MSENNQKVLISILTVIAICLVILTYYIVSDFYAYDFGKIEKFCADSNGTCESIAVAYQLGRLDFVSVCLAMLGVIVGLSAIFGFLSIKEKSEYIAKTTAEDNTKDRLDKFEVDTLPSMLEEKVSVLFDQYVIIKEKQNGKISPQVDWEKQVEDNDE